MVGYIYKTVNLVNGMIYIGRRKKSKFESGYLGSGKLLFRAIKKYGRDNFYVRILRRCFTIERLNESEKEFIRKYKSTNNKIGYNIANGGQAAMEGRHHSEKTKQKIRNKHIGKVMDEQTKQKISEANKKVKHNAIWNERMRKALTGRKYPPEFGEKISKIMKGKMVGEKNPMYGRKQSEETKRKIGEANRGRKRSLESIQKRVNKIKGRKNSPETIKKMSEARKLYYENKRKNESI